MQRHKAGLNVIWAAMAVGAALAGAAQAAPNVTITSTPGPDLAPLAPAGTNLALTVDFDSPLPSGVTLTGGYQILSGSITDVAAAPAGDTSKYLAVPYPNFSGSAQMNFSSAFSSGPKLEDVSFYYGSIDAYNTITLLDSKGVAFDTFTGSLFPPANGDQQSPQSNRMVNIALGPDQTLGGIILASSQPALEVDNFRFYTSAAPEPGTWALMIVGFGLVGAMLRNARSMLGRQVVA